MKLSSAMVRCVSLSSPFQFQSKYKNISLYSASLPFVHLTHTLKIQISSTYQGRGISSFSWAVNVKVCNIGFIWLSLKNPVGNSHSSPSPIKPVSLTVNGWSYLSKFSCPTIPFRMMKIKTKDNICRKKKSTVKKNMKSR